MTRLDIYTHGSKTSVGTRSGIFSDESCLNLSVSIDNSCTVFQAEVKAAEGDKRQRYFVIREQSSCDNRESINQVANQNTVRICWVSERSNHEGNEEVDRLARPGRHRKIRSSREFNPPLDGWVGSNNCSISKLFWPAVSEENPREMLGTRKICQNLLKCWSFEPEPPERKTYRHDIWKKSKTHLLIISDWNIWSINLILENVGPGHQS